jgi:hypothetical protein
MAGKIKRHGFISELPVIHWLAIFVSGKEQSGEQVIPVLLPGSPCCNEALDRLV